MIATSLEPSSSVQRESRPGAFALRERELFYRRLIWAFPIAFAFHVMEEARGFPAWVRDTLHAHMEVRSFFVNNTLFMIVLLGFCALAAWKRTRLATTALFVWVSGQIFWNAMFHLYTELAFHTYSPGLVTAVLLYVPTFLYVAYVALRERFVSPLAMGIAVAAGAPGMAFTVWAALYRFEAPPCSWWLCG